MAAHGRRSPSAHPAATARRRRVVGRGRRGDGGRGVRRAHDARTRASPGQLVDDQGGLHKFVNVYCNDDDIRYLDQLDTKVADGDVISILPAVAGG